LGSQTGGSITRPAAYCGVAGLKPTFGTLDLSGVVPISRHLDHLGVLARTPGDLSAMFDAMSPVGPPRAAWSPLIHPPVLHPIAHFFLEEADEDVRQVTQAAYDALRSAGAELQTLQLPPSFAQIPPLHRLIMAAEAAENHLDTFARNAPAYGPQVGGLILEGLATSAADYLRALRHQDVLRGEVERLFGNEIIAMSPATVTAAPATLDTTGDPRFNSPWSYVGLPTVTIPCGLTPDHMPCGLQLIGPPHRERELLSAAAWCAGILGGTPPPPLLSRP
jgi:Asp-tRNA(Asn)/Glu-tRNA(Gln) amidotransferase A subunit family amidase